MSDYAPFESPAPSKVYHIIWNILLADKQFSLSPQSLKENKIGHIVAILPSREEFEKIAGKDTLATIIEYGDRHEPELDKPKCQEICQMIDDIARSSKKEEERNVLVFCNNGYQRSIPFLVYYLTTFHKDECPTISKAIDLILPQVDKFNYLSLREQTINDITNILTT